MSISFQWFGMKMSQQWSSVASAFRFLITILTVLIHLPIMDEELA